MSTFILHFGSLIIFVLLQFSCAQQPSTYYIDAVSGKDGNSGNTPQEAWQSIARVNRAIFRPGDKILFKTGCKWRETLTISHSGTSQNPIIYDAYGAEQKPVITAVDLLVGTDGNYWMSHNDSIWYLQKTADPKRLWLNGKEYPRSLDIKHINQHFRWYYEENTQRLYLFNWNKPENSTMKIEIATGRDMAVVARNADYITIRNIALEGGSLFSLHINYCDYVVIENCEVGKYSGKYGFFASHSSQGILRDCQVDSWHRIKYTYDYAAVEDGIKLYNGCSGWEIYRNEVKDWGHSCIQIQSKDRQNPTSNNRIYSNILSAKNVAYCRGFELAGPEESCQNNEIFRNIIAYTSVRNQLGGDHNLIHHNIFHNLSNVTYRNDGTAQVASFSNHEENACHDISFYHNVLVNSDEPAIRIVNHIGGNIYNIFIKNNIVYNCGRNSREDLTGVGLFIGKEGNIRQISIQYNDFFLPDGKMRIYYRGMLKKLSELIEMDLKNENNISKNIEADPLFISIENQNFKLMPESPCISLGIPVGIENDFLGNPIPSEGPANIGAFQSFENDH
ncbi:MAG: right-handed parallel beta-helix repeat-containing protein [bacterium]|nr:MAG: right-handed parallel beta-helix repeat-containing protein [bacterium]